MNSMPDDASLRESKCQCVCGKSPDFPDLARLLVPVKEQWHIESKAVSVEYRTGLQLRDSP